MECLHDRAVLHLTRLNFLSIPSPLGTHLVVYFLDEDGKTRRTTILQSSNQVNNGAEAVLANKERTSKNKRKIFKNSKPTLATILVDRGVDREIISESFIEEYWLQVIEPYIEMTKNDWIK